MAAIDARELRCEYAPGRGVAGVTLAVEPGRCVALLGRNGSGKTTLTRMLLGLLRPGSGELRVLGCDVASGGRGHLRRCGAVLDRTSQYESLSARQNAMFVARSFGLGRVGARRRVSELLALADLADRADDAVATFSYGMKRKLALIEALAHDPDLLILDEPTGGIDAQFLARLALEIRSRSANGKTTWLAGSDAEWFADAADSVAMIDAGRIVAEGSVAELLAELAPTRELKITLRRPVAIDPPDMPDLRSMTAAGCVITAVASGGPAAVGALVQHVVSRGGDIESLEVRQSTLRDAFLIQTGKAIDG